MKNLNGVPKCPFLPEKACDSECESYITTTLNGCTVSACLAPTIYAKMNRLAILYRLDVREMDTQLERAYHEEPYAEDTDLQ